MGRPPSNGGPSFRFTQPEIAEMESILQAHKTAMPERQVLVNLSEKFSNSEERKGKIEVQMKQVWNWFQNRRYAIRAKQAKHPGKLDISQMPRDTPPAMVKSVPQPPTSAAAASAPVRTFPQPPQQPTVPSAAVRTLPQAPPQPAFSGRVTDNSQMEYEAKSARDGAWYDVSTFLSHRSLDTGDPEVMVRFAGFGAEEDEWVNVRKNVRQRSLPCEASECVAVLPADLILCFQEGKEQALYFDAHVLDAQRRRHDVRGCRCRFLVRYDHDQSEEIVALRKICRRPETDYRLQQLHAVNESLSVNQNKNGANNNIHTASTLRVYPPAEVQPKQNSAVPPTHTESPQKRQRLDSTVQPEGSQTQFKVEPVVLGDVPQNQQRVQPAVPTPSAQPIVEPPKLESVAPSPSIQASAELKNVPMVVTRSAEVPLELQKVQPVMPDPSTEVPVDTHKVENVVPSSGEATQELPTVETNVIVPLPEASEEHHKTEPFPSGEIPQETQAVGPTVPRSAEITVEAPVESHEQEPEVAEPQKEPVIPAELQEVQPAVPDQPRTNALETKTEESVAPVVTDDTNVVEVIETKTEEPVVHVSTNVTEEATDTKTEEPVPTDDTIVAEEEAIETKTEEPEVSANDANVVEESVETKTEEPVVPTNDSSLVEETIKSKTEEPLVPVDDHNMIEAEIGKPHISETMENNEEKNEEIAENMSDHKVENSDLEPENTAIAMEEG